MDKRCKATKSEREERSIIPSFSTNAHANESERERERCLPLEGVQIEAGKRELIWIVWKLDSWWILVSVASKAWLCSEKHEIKTKKRGEYSKDFMKVEEKWEVAMMRNLVKDFSLWATSFYNLVYINGDFQEINITHLVNSGVNIILFSSSFFASMEWIHHSWCMFVTSFTL